MPLRVLHLRLEFRRYIRIDRQARDRPVCALFFGYGRPEIDGGHGVIVRPVCYRFETGTEPKMMAVRTHPMDFDLCALSWRGQIKISQTKLSISGAEVLTQKYMNSRGI